MSNKSHSQTFVQMVQAYFLVLKTQVVTQIITTFTRIKKLQNNGHLNISFHIVKFLAIIMLVG